MRRPGTRNGTNSASPESTATSSTVSVKSLILAGWLAALFMLWRWPYEHNAHAEIVAQDSTSQSSEPHLPPAPPLIGELRRDEAGRIELVPAPPPISGHTAGH